MDVRADKKQVTSWARVYKIELDIHDTHLLRDILKYYVQKNAGTTVDETVSFGLALDDNLFRALQIDKEKEHLGARA